MRKLRSIIFMLLIMLSLFTASAHANVQAVQATNQATDPESVLRAIFAALNDGDVDGAVKLIADDAVLVHIPPPPGFQNAMDKAMLRTWWKQFAGRHGRIEITEIHVYGDKAVFAANTSEDFFTTQGVPVMVANFVAIVQDGLLHSFTINFTKASQAIFGNALARTMNKEAIRRNYDEMWSKGNLALVDEISDPKLMDRHTGQTGTAGIKQTVTLFRKAFPELKVTIDNLLGEGDLVVAEVTFDYGPYKGGLQDAFGVPDSAIGKKVKGQAVDFYRFKQGKIVEAWGLFDELNWDKQLGFELVPPTKQ